MERTSTASIRLAQVALLLLFGWSVFRAVTQSATIGEARNYDRFIGPSWQESLAHFDGNNHVLNTILVRIATARIHLTEFSLRLPSLLAGVLYLWAAYRLARRYFGAGPMFLAVVGLLAFHPMVVDGLSEARGYGMALAAWTWALILILESVESFSATKFNLAGVLLGVSVAASLAFLLPAAMLILAVALYQWSIPAKMPHLAFLTGFVFLAVPMNHADPSALWVNRHLGGSAVFLVPLLTLVVAAAVRHRESPRFYFLIAAALCVGIYLDRLHLPYRGAAHLEGGKELAKVLRADAMRRGVRVAVSEEAEPILRFYRWRYRQGNWQTIDSDLKAPHDYYVVTPKDVDLIRERNLRVLYRDPGLILAR